MKLNKLIKTMGPGLLWAGAAIGVSHLVQSTRAGAGFGFSLVGVLIFANLVKYPFFEIAPRYSASTGQNLIEGYRKIGRWAVLIYLLLTISTMFTIQAAVTVVTSGLISGIFGLKIDAGILSAIILVFSALIILVGKYKMLDRIVKVIIVILAISTVLAVVFGLFNGYHPDPSSSQNFDWTNGLHLLFFFAFVGWMPAPLDVSVWHSFWTTEKIKEKDVNLTMKDSIRDFNIGFIGTAVLAIGFLTLGALFMYGTGEKFSNNGSEFAGQLIKLYTDGIGEWSYWIIAIAALTTMISTTITCIDAYPRVLKPTTEILIKGKVSESNSLFYFFTILLIAGTAAMILFLSKTMSFMVDLATTLSVVTAPAFAIMNYSLIRHKHVPESAKQGKFLKIYSLISIILLIILSVAYLVWKVS